MPYHVFIRLPDDRVACADYREPIAKVMHKINERLSQRKPADPRWYAEVGAWLDTHGEQSVACQEGSRPDGAFCGHD